MRLSPQSVALERQTRALHGDRRLGPGCFCSRGVADLYVPTRAARYSPGPDCNNPDSKQAQTLLEQRLSGPRRSNEVVIVRSDSRTVTAPSSRLTCSSSRATWTRSRPAVVQQATDPYQAGNRLVSPTSTPS